jgi:hypothetical protein
MEMPLLMPLPLPRKLVMLVMLVMLVVTLSPSHCCCSPPLPAGVQT